MPTIHTLPQDVINKIAAGEVIERPAYAVKELLDNAIDAKATQITITIEESGLKRVQVQDNGKGMIKEDLLLSFLPHTTSKLKKAEELIGIKTLGFRGEALASIAAVAHVTIKSRTLESTSGTEIVVKEGKVEECKPTGMPAGTIVTVDNLFYSVPARKKFLKTAKTEFRHIVDVVMQYALSYPTIHFLLTHNKKTVLDLPIKENTLERIHILLGSDITRYLIPFTFEEGSVKGSGFIGKPQLASKQNQKQYLFINNRYVTDRLIAATVRNAYGTLLPPNSTPIFVLQLSIPHEFVDVNVHPRKEQVSFTSVSTVMELVRKGIEQTLSSHNLVHNFAKLKNELSTKMGETQSFAGNMLRDAVLPWNTGELGVIRKEAPFVQIHNTYIMTVTESGMLLIDQHAAHERVLYEQFLKAFDQKKKRKEQYQLPKPLSLDLSVTDGQLLEEHLPSFETLGFAIEHFQGNTFIIRAVPEVFKGRNIEKIVADMLVDMSNEVSRNLDVKTQRMLAFLSCRGAVKAGDALTKEQCQKLGEQLEETKNNTTCPHGRPTKIIVTIKELNNLFKRG